MVDILDGGTSLLIYERCIVSDWESSMSMMENTCKYMWQRLMMDDSFFLKCWTAIFMSDSSPGHIGSGVHTQLLDGFMIILSGSRSFHS